MAVLAAWPGAAQEAESGFDLRMTAAAGAAYSDQLAQAPRDGRRETAGFRMVVYPLWKLSRHWSIGGAVQFLSRPYFVEDFGTQGYGLKADTLQANLGFSQFWKGGSLVVRAGLLSSAFGSYLLHYDDGENALIDKPVTYGYYGKGVTTLGLAAVQGDLTIGRWDMRAQLASSSPANRRGIGDRDQYANWAGGVGYTIRQSIRAGASIYRGPYLNRGYQYFFPGESDPVNLPATAFGFDGQWARGHWNAGGEWQRFVYTYHAIPTYRAHAGYGEIRRVLNPRWYAAVRLGYIASNYEPERQVHEFAVGYRAADATLVKIAYQMQRASNPAAPAGNTLALQVVHSLHVLSIGRD
jgi:hypothetical protein